MKEMWMLAAKKADFAQIGKDFSIDPVVARLIRNRDIVGNHEIQKYLYATKKDLYAPELMKGVKEAAELLLFKIRGQKKIRVIGDYDIDGIMSSYVLVKGLKRVGADVGVRIPDRIIDGYGLNENLVIQAHEDGIDTIVTCDNGIAAAEQIALAKSYGMTVIVTDHHQVPYEEDEQGKKQYILPPADVVVNPKQEGCKYPFKGLCGAGVAWKVISELYELAGIPSKEGEEFLEFVAIATIGDVMDLKDENRIIVKEGLNRLHRTKHLGLKELIAVNKLDQEAIDVYHVGFVLGPCLNASGRLDTATRGLSLMLAESKEDAARLAGDLKNLNDSRKEMTAEGEAKAKEMVENSSLKDDKVLVVYLPDCHESLAGIIAGRLREEYGKPSFVITKTHEGLKGSGRSIPSYSMYDELSACKSYLTKFGGHPMAAGISLREENLIPFRKALNEACTLTEDDFAEKISIDVAMPIHYLSMKLMNEMELLKPFGTGNTKPLFAQKNVKVLYPKVYGKNRNVVKMTVVSENGYSMDAVYFGKGDAFLDYVQNKNMITIAYYPKIDTYNGRNRLQVNITNYR